ncbi:hypothetical protein ARALYDRAFT_312655 [Arabidopsis lyrata subsp. lyrata]|uniref:Uncharacterized protein n=1 Tax=Arabidopsis lyrata subsp. lyrata TaxID=81972 RepID=D7KEJ2_ARALL|nr:hypothetical protein ARALYDRAFT_312655 [Arabidopsis lyrata subsp. lyrata]
MAHISDIKLIRTDTTLDLSQKAEKGMIWKLDINYDKFCPFYKSVWMVIHFYNLANQRVAGVDGWSEDYLHSHQTSLGDLFYLLV